MSSRGRVGSRSQAMFEILMLVEPWVIDEYRTDLR